MEKLRPKNSRNLKKNIIHVVTQIFQLISPVLAVITSGKFISKKNMKLAKILPFKFKNNLKKNIQKMVISP